ncbi:MAG: hypothetical protein C0603_05690 [Denitrovibrio sp.]|nr:MAG: hypothetical protein C0603_05690 [Denitrovibrio sp.]
MYVYFNIYFLFVFNRIYAYILYMTVGQRLKELRKELKISQKELGTLLNVAQQVISYYENSGNIDASKLSIISKKYGVDIRFFFEDKPISNYRGTILITNSVDAPIIPAGWDDLLDDLSGLDYDKIQIIETVVKTLIKEYSK